MNNVKNEVKNEEFERPHLDAMKEIESILNQLKNDHPKMSEGVASILGSGTGFASSLALLGGTTGFSAAGITSGLATAGALIGGGMLAGIGVFATPAIILGIGCYKIARDRKNAKYTIALNIAIKRLYEIQERLLKNAEYFKEELAYIKAVIDILLTEGDQRHKESQN